MADCKYGDPTCPCQDGDICHYEGENPMNVPPEYVRAKCERLRGALRECEEYFDQRADADQPSGMSPIPNEEMTLLMEVRAALADGE